MSVDKLEAEPTLRPSLHDPGRAQKNAARRNRARWVKRVLLILGAGAIILALAYAFAPSPVEVDLGAARRIALAVHVEEDGRTRVRERYLVSAPLAGDLARIDVEPGDTVSAGDVLARLRPLAPVMLDARTRLEAEARLDAALARERQASSAAARARAGRDLAVREAERVRALFDQTAVSEAQRDRAVVEERFAVEELAGAELGKRVAAAEVRATRVGLQVATVGSGVELPVEAPEAGVVLSVMRESAGPVLAGTPLLALGDPRSLEVVVDVLSADAARIAPAARVEIERWGGDHTLIGRVRRVEPGGFTRVSALGVEEQRVNVIVALDHPPATLGDGFRVEARIVVWEGTNVLAVPSSAVFRHGDGWAVFEIVDGSARVQPIEIGHRGRHDVEVLAGLADGCQVVLYPGDRVREGVQVVARP